LGVYAHGIATGEIEGRGYTADDLPKGKGQAAEQSVVSVNLELLQRRMLAHEEEGSGDQTAVQLVLILLTEGNKLRLAKVQADWLTEKETVNLPVQIPDNESRILAAQVVTLDEPLLLATSFFRFLLTSPALNMLTYRPEKYRGCIAKASESDFPDLICFNTSRIASRSAGFDARLAAISRLRSTGKPA
jgi:hypothetical protein